jgi:hypothetical protein
MTAPAVPVLFLAGIGRSGTTLIERTLGECEGVTALGEVMHLWDRGLTRHELCGCGLPFADCPFWSEVGKRAFGGWDHVDTDRMAYLKGRVDRAIRVPSIALRRPRDFDAEADEYVEHFVRLYRAAHDMVGGVLIDSSKQVSLAWLLRRSPDIDLRVAHCIRDSRGVAASWAKETVRPEAVDAEHRLMPRYSSSQISAYWVLHNTEIEALGRSVPLERVRYEDFVATPAETTQRMLGLVDVHDDLAHVQETSITLGRNHSCAGNPMRFKDGEIRLVKDERWRREMPARQRRVVTALTAPLLRRYDYDL